MFLQSIPTSNLLPILQSWLVDQVHAWKPISGCEAQYRLSSHEVSHHLSNQGVSSRPDKSLVHCQTRRFKINLWNKLRLNYIHSTMISNKFDSAISLAVWSSILVDQLLSKVDAFYKLIMCSQACHKHTQTHNAIDMRVWCMQLLRLSQVLMVNE